jgi:hypothetical protein
LKNDLLFHQQNLTQTGKISRKDIWRKNNQEKQGDTATGEISMCDVKN